MKNAFLSILLVSLFLSVPAWAQPEPLTDGMASWETVDGLTIEPPIDVTQSIDDEYPSIAIDSEGTLWVAWSRRGEERDEIYISSFKNGEWSPEVKLSDESSSYKPEVVCDKDDTLHIIWSAKSGNTWKTNTCTYSDGKKSNILESPVEGSSQDADTVLDSDGQIQTVRESEGDIYVGAVNISENNADEGAPCIAASPDGTIWVAWHRYLGSGNADIFLRKHQDGVWEPEIQITDSPAGDFYPSIGLDSRGRVWIAWHGNQDDPLRITNWIDVRCWDGKELLRPKGEMPGKSVNKSNTDQGFEFPTLHVDKKDRVWVLGRPSQNFCVQYYEGDAWSPLFRLPEDGWGGRGQYVAVIENAEGALWTARRDMQYNKIQKIVPGSATKKKLTAAPVANLDTSLTPLNAMEEIDYSIGDYKLYFGDIHSHTWMSDGMSSIDEYWTRMRDVMGWDFSALTDHDFFVGNKISHCEWEELKSVADSYNKPGTFAAIHAYEWTTARPPLGFGHKNVYFAGDDPPLFNRAEQVSKTAQGLYGLLRPYKALAFPHHIAWTGADWDNFAPDIETCFEIVSNHGVFEYMGNEPIHHRGGRKGEFVQDGLAMGLQFGIVGGSDSHGLRWHHQAGYKENPWEAGSTAVYATELSREGVIEALRSRRCYATTGVKIQMEVQSDGHLMGDSYSTDIPPTLSVRVQGTASVHYAILVRNNEDILYDGGNTDLVKFEYTDEKIAPGLNYYYVRFIQEDGNMAWSSPIWVQYTGH